MQPFLTKAKSVVAKPYLFEGAILLSFLFFSIYPGALRDVMLGCGLLFLLNLLAGSYRITNLNTASMAMIVGFLVILLANFSAPDDVVHPRSLSYFIAFPGMAMAVHTLAIRKAKTEAGYSSLIYAIIVSIAVILNASALLWLQKSDGFGSVYSNPHHLGLFASLTLPLLFFWMIVQKGWILRLVLAGISLVDLLLLFESNSKVSWLAFAIGSGLAIIVFLRGRRRIFTAGGLFLMSMIGAGIYGIPRIIDSVQFFFLHLSKEARWTLWANTWELIKDSDLSQWLFGHGIGSFRYYITDYTFTSTGGKTINFSFPHNGILQILFENGMVGCVVVFGGFLATAICLMKGYTSLRSDKTRYLVITLFAVLLMTFIHFMLTKSFYSKYIQYVLSIIVGTTLALSDEFKTQEPISDKGDNGF